MVTTLKTTPPAAPAKAAAAAPAKLAAPAKVAAPAKKVAPKPALKKVVKKAAPRTKAPVKKAVKAAVKAVPAKTATAKPVKEKKPKLVRDSFTIPKAEYSVLDELKQRGGKLGSPVKKSELLRAGIKALAAMADSAFVAALKAVPAVKTGRPAKD
ncbi:MAG: hypothetical protein NTX31_12400 [Burkholderiales bacterium]|nr:hypothetical protein [Burkholderiales bacterium]